MALRIVSLSPVFSSMGQTWVRGMASAAGGKNIGFIGLGNMGGHMASNLMKQGHKLHVFDISQAACDNLKSKGATVYKDTADLALKSDFVITMLPNNDIAKKAFCRDEYLGTSTHFLGED